MYVCKRPLAKILHFFYISTINEAIHFRSTLQVPITDKNYPSPQESQSCDPNWEPIIQTDTGVCADCGWARWRAIWLRMRTFLFLSLNSKYNDDVTDELNIQSTELVHLDNITALYRDVTVTIAP